MTETNDKQTIEQGLKLQDEFAGAKPSQDMLGDIPEDALPRDYRDKVKLRMTRDNFYIAFSDDPDSLEPNNEGFVPSAHIKKVSAYTTPRSLGKSIKGWIDQTREAESKD